MRATPNGTAPPSHTKVRASFLISFLICPNECPRGVPNPARIRPPHVSSPIHTLLAHSSLNVLHLWDFVEYDLIELGVKLLDPSVFASVDYQHVGTSQLQHSLLKVTSVSRL